MAASSLGGVSLLRLREREWSLRLVLSHKNVDFLFFIVLKRHILIHSDTFYVKFKISCLQYHAQAICYMRHANYHRRRNRMTMELLAPYVEDAGAKVSFRRAFHKAMRLTESNAALISKLID